LTVDNDHVRGNGAWLVPIAKLFLRAANGRCAAVSAAQPMHRDQEGFIRATRQRRPAASAAAGSPRQNQHLALALQQNQHTHNIIAGRDYANDHLVKRATVPIGGSAEYGSSKRSGAAFSLSAVGEVRSDKQPPTVATGQAVNSRRLSSARTV
jgi:hypothetical protein